MPFDGLMRITNACDSLAGVSYEDLLQKLRSASHNGTKLTDGDCVVTIDESEDASDSSSDTCVIV